MRKLLMTLVGAALIAGTLSASAFPAASFPSALGGNDVTPAQFYIGPDGFQVGPFYVPLPPPPPVYVAPPPVIVQPPPVVVAPPPVVVAPPVVIQPPAPVVTGACFVNAVDDYGRPFAYMNVRTFPNGPIIGALPTGTPVSILDTRYDPASGLYWSRVVGGGMNGIAATYLITCQ